MILDLQVYYDSAANVANIQSDALVLRGYLQGLEDPYITCTQGVL